MWRKAEVQCTEFSSQWKRKANYFALDRHDRQFNRCGEQHSRLERRRASGIWKLERSKRLVEQKILSPKASLVMMSSRSDSISSEELCPDVCYPHMLPVGMVRKQFKSVSVFWGRQRRHFLGLFLISTREKNKSMIIKIN